MKRNTRITQEDQSDERLIIDPVKSKMLLSSLKLPYTVYIGSKFDLEDHIMEIECDYSKKEADNTPPTIVTKREQVGQWLACMESAKERKGRGWTLSIAGPGSIAYPEKVAAQLAAEYLKRSRAVCWVNVTASLRGERELERLAAPYPINALDAIFLTGLRWDGDPLRFDKSFDLLRQTLPKTDRIIVGAGIDPLSITRWMDISVNRALQVVETKIVNMTSY